MPRLLTLCLLAGLLLPRSSAAERFDTRAEVYCPASVTTPVATGIEIADTAMTAFTLVPCAGLRVTVLDADPLWDEYCGAAYTDSRGRVSIPSDCGDALGDGPDVYVRVESRSMLGFSVGVHDYGLLDAAWDAIFDAAKAALTGGATLPLTFIDYLRSHATFAWISDERPPVGIGAIRTADFGAIAIGGPTPGVAAADDVSIRSGRQFWVAQYSMQRLVRGARQRAMDFNYSVDAPLFGTPTTLYDTVIVEDAEFASSPVRVLNATPHEIGHVFYNTLHSGFLHWTTDGPDYMTNHARCDTDHFLTFAWYEGFANFVEDWVFNHYDWNNARWVHARPQTACTTGTPPTVVPGVHIEGNVQSILNEVYFGPIHAFTQAGIAAPTPMDFGCPAGTTRLQRSNGVVECLRSAPIECSHRAGVLFVDRVGQRDQCFVEDPVTPPTWMTTTCPTGEVVRRRSGRDACERVFPATHLIPSGRPSMRADGTPSQTLARDAAGVLGWYALPNLGDVFGWVARQGTAGHRMRTFWTEEIQPWCASAPTRYCDPRAARTFGVGLSIIAPSLPQ
ncbi:MAG: hypothetical protein R3F35_12825 [Myxococcota bacterium]